VQLALRNRNDASCGALCASPPEAESRSGDGRSDSWTPSGARTHSFEVAPSDVIELSLEEIERQPLKLKAAAVGRRRDLLLLAELTSTHQSLSDQFALLDTKFSDGLTQGKPAKQTRDASEMKGLEFLQTNDMQHFHIPNNLPIYDQSSAQWPRSRDTYRAPLLIVKEMVVGHPRALVAVANRDVVFTDSFFAASLPWSHKQSAHLLAAILSSALASWFFGLTASEFGIYKRKLLMRDVGFLPVPDLRASAKSPAGRRLLDLEKVLRKQEIGAQEWNAVDEAVFDLYELSDADRVVVLDGLLRAGWQWEDGREASVVPSDSRSEMVAYAQTFLSVMNGWFSARNKRHMRAEVMDLPRGAALRVVRFVVEDGPGEATISLVNPQGELHDMLTRIGQRLKVKIATALSAERELRVHGRNELVIIKPAARRHWMRVAALEDADTVVAESFLGGDV